MNRIKATRSKQARAVVGLTLLLTLSPCHLVTLSTRAGDGEEAAEANRLCETELSRWQLSSDGTKLANPTAPVLRWTNPAVGRLYGNTYLWLDDGRPVAVGCMYRFYDPFQTFNGELALLAGSGMVAKRGERELWRPSVKWKWTDVPDAPVPAATRAGRLFQMRSLAKRFGVVVLDSRNVRKPEGVTPRLLAKPLYRYDQGESKSLDGALYAFVLGTDPELMLLLECDTGQGNPRWRFGVGRMNRDAVRLTLGKETVWERSSLEEDNPEDGEYRFFDLGLAGEGRDE